MDPKMSGGALWTPKMVQEMKKSESSQSFEEKFPGVWIRKKKKKDMSRFSLLRNQSALNGMNSQSARLKCGETTFM